MCGISGYFSINDRQKRPDGRERLSEQIATLRYRGPDWAAYHVGEGFGLGHARLSIIDLSHGANQPMLDSEGHVSLVFNGEIYNYQELREELKQKGHKFKTQSDTEVVLEGYKAWGEAVVDRLRGMFAIALFDHKKDRLVLLRDRTGQKPLFYALHDNILLFASEAKGILCWPGFKRKPNYDAIDMYLTYQYVPSPHCAFEGVYKLPPAHKLVIERGGQQRLEKYFSLTPPNQSVKTRKSEAELCEELLGHFKEATRLRMIADVPLGAFLSGGVDSSSVVAMMAMNSAKPVKTFTIGFEEQAYDERVYAQQVVERYDTDHQEFTVKPDGMAIINDLVYHYNEPYADSSAIPTYYVSKIAREHVTVVLNGDGGDESFLGYTRYLNIRRGEMGLAETVQGGLKTRAKNLLKAIRDRHKAADTDEVDERLPSRKYEQYIAYFSDEAKKWTYADGMKHHLDVSRLDLIEGYFQQADTYTAGAAWADVHTYLPEDLNVKVDIASMANSLEARSPFLDHKLMKWASGLPEHLKFKGLEPKSLLKKAMEPYLPHGLMYRPKMGFGVPYDLWLRNEMHDFARSTLLEGPAKERGLFQLDYIETMLDWHKDGQNWATRLWALLMLELWFQMWIDGPLPTIPQASTKRIIEVPA